MVHGGLWPISDCQEAEGRKVECPTVHWMKMGRNAPANTPDDPYGWAPDTVFRHTGEAGVPWYTWLTSKLVGYRTRAKRNSKTLLTNGRFSRTPMKQLLTKDTFARVQELRRTNADLPEQAKPICSPVSFAVPIAVRNCTTVPARVLKPDKTTSFAPPPAKA